MMSPILLHRHDILSFTFKYFCNEKVAIFKTLSSFDVAATDVGSDKCAPADIRLTSFSAVLDERLESLILPCKVEKNKMLKIKKSKIK